MRKLRFGWLILALLTVLVGCASAPPVVLTASAVTERPVYTLEQPAVSPAPAPQHYPVIIEGAKPRVDLVVEWLRARGIVAKAHYSAEVMGSFNRKPWPGVRVSTSDSGEIFIPLSDKVVRTGVLCEDQTDLLRGVKPRAKSVPVAKPAPQPQPCRECEPLVLKACVKVGFSTFRGETLKFDVCPTMNEFTPGVISGKWLYDGKEWILSTVVYFDNYDPKNPPGWPSKNHPVWQHLSSIVPLKGTLPANQKQWQPCYFKAWPPR